jgi:hypothetical protein
MVNLRDRLVLLRRIRNCHAAVASEFDTKRKKHARLSTDDVIPNTNHHTHPVFTVETSTREAVAVAEPASHFAAPFAAAARPIAAIDSVEIDAGQKANVQKANDGQSLSTNGTATSSRQVGM